MSTSTKQKPRDLIAYCGLYCGDCPGHQGTIADLARDLRKELRQARFDKTAALLCEIPFFRVYKDYPQCYQVLGAMVKMRCRRACRGGGSNPACKPRKCAQKKGFEGCWECDEFETCAKLKFLEANHGDAVRRNLRALKRRGTAGFLEGKHYWYTPPRKSE